MSEAGIVAVIVALINAGAWIIGAWVAARLRKDVKEVKHATNSMKDELVRIARAEGVVSGRAQERAESAVKDNL